MSNGTQKLNCKANCKTPIFLIVLIVWNMVLKAILEKKENKKLSYIMEME